MFGGTTAETNPRALLLVTEHLGTVCYAMASLPAVVTHLLIGETIINQKLINAFIYNQSTTGVSDKGELYPGNGKL